MVSSDSYHVHVSVGLSTSKVIYYTYVLTHDQFLYPKQIGARHVPVTPLPRKLEIS